MVGGAAHSNTPSSQPTRAKPRHTNLADEELRNLLSDTFCRTDINATGGETTTRTKTMRTDDETLV